MQSPLSLRYAVLLALLAAPGALLAQSQGATPEPDQIDALRDEIESVRRQSQLEIDNLRKESDRKISALLQQIDELRASAKVSNGPASQTGDSQGKTGLGDRFDVSGDFRLRYENNTSFNNSEGYDRGVIRGRLTVSYAAADSVKLGARLVTGDPDNPRTSDTTIGDFARDLTVSLDQLYAEYHKADLTLVGGKFAKPFLSTELVWDGDVNPQGLGGRYKFLDNSSLSAELAATYFMIDQSTSPTSADMLGTQISASWHPNADWKVSLGLSYFDYDIPVIQPGLPGGARGNNVLADGVTYVSDFKLFDTIATVDYFGLGDKWPLQVVADYVVNQGAAVPEDTGYAIDIFGGRLDHQGALRLRYGYSEAETDAVLGLFSHDNIRLATNYRLHTLSVDYALLDNTFVGLTYYRFREKDPVLVPGITNDWTSRTRLNLYYSF